MFLYISVSTLSSFMYNPWQCIGFTVHYTHRLYKDSTFISSPVLRCLTCLCWPYGSHPTRHATGWMSYVTISTFRKNVFLRTSFLQFAVSYSISQSQGPVGFEYWFSVLSAEQLADLLLEQYASLRRHFTSQTRFYPLTDSVWARRRAAATLVRYMELSLNDKRGKNANSLQFNASFLRWAYCADRVAPCFAVRGNLVS